MPIWSGFRIRCVKGVPRRAAPWCWRSASTASILETPRGDKKEEITIKVPLGTQIKKDHEDIFLPALRGNLVAVTHVSDNGEKVAKSIEVIKKP